MKVQNRLQTQYITLKPYESEILGQMVTSIGFNLLQFVSVGRHVVLVTNSSSMLFISSNN
jgi:hypothetical protein